MGASGVGMVSTPMFYSQRTLDRNRTFCDLRRRVRIVRLVRNILGIRQEDLARRSQLSTRELARIERGDAHPTAATARAIDDAIEAEVDDRLARAKSEQQETHVRLVSDSDPTL